MSTINVKVGGTLSVTGGTDKTFTSVQTSGNEYLYQDLSVSDFRLRPTLKVRIVRPQVAADAPNGYTQGRAYVTLLEPRLLANGKIAVDKCIRQVSFDVETSAANKIVSLDILSQIGFTANAAQAIFTNLAAP